MTLSPVFELAISLPFKVDALGKVGASVEQSKVWADRVRSVLGTAYGQRVYRPNFGCNATLGIFDSEEYVLEQIREDIDFAFQTFLPLLTVDSINVEIDPSTQVINTEVIYSTPSGADFQVVMGIASVGTDGTVSEEFRWQTL